MATIIPPAPIGAPFTDYSWIDWYQKVRRAINEVGEIDHNNLLNIQGGSVTERYHLTSSEHAALTTNLNETIDDRVAALLVAGTNIDLTYDDGAGTLTVDATGAGYTLPVQALQSNPTDSVTVYFGGFPRVPSTTANEAKVYVPRSGTIKAADIFCFSTTAGTAEGWSLYIRVNNTTDYLVQTLAVASSDRLFTNNSLSISVSAGDYFQIKGVQPLWATNPAATSYSGNIYIE